MGNVSTFGYHFCRDLKTTKKDKKTKKRVWDGKIRLTDVVLISGIAALIYGGYRFNKRREAINNVLRTRVGSDEEVERVIEAAENPVARVD